MHFVESASFPVGDSCSVRTQRALYQSSAQRTTIATKHYCLHKASLLEGGGMIPADAGHEVIRHSAGAIDVSE
jgi:hypothetical protein